MKKTIALLLLNLVNYPVILLFYIYGINRNWFTTLCVIIFNLSFTHKYYELLKFYKQNGEQVTFSVRYEIVDLLSLLLIMLESMVRGFYDIKAVTGILAFLVTMIIVLTGQNEILVAKNFIYYKYKVLPKNFFKVCHAVKTEGGEFLFLKLLGKIKKPSSQKTDYELYKYQYNNRSKIIEIKKEYVKYFQ